MLFIPTALVLSSCSISIRAGFSRSKQSLLLSKPHPPPVIKEKISFTQASKFKFLIKGAISKIETLRHSRNLILTYMKDILKVALQ